MAAEDKLQFVPKKWWFVLCKQFCFGVNAHTQSSRAHIKKLPEPGIVLSACLKAEGELLMDDTGR